MSITEKHYHGGVELIYPFEEYEDTDTAFIKRIYHLDQSRHLAKKTKFREEIDYSLLSDFPELRAKRPWLLNTKTGGEPPSRVRVEEIYGYVPTVTHRYPSSISWTRPGIGFDSTTKPEWSGEDFRRGYRSGYVTLGSTPDFAVGALCTVVITYSIGTFTTLTTATLQSNTCKVRFISGNAVEIVDQTPGTGTSLNELANAYRTSLSQGGSPTVTLSVSAAGNREPRSFNVPCTIVRDYFRSNSANPQWLPPVIEPWAVRDSGGAIVESLGATTKPTIDQYKSRIGEMIVADYSSIGKVYGDVWYRETPYTKLI